MLSPRSYAIRPPGPPRHAHQAEADEQQAVLASAEATAAQVRAEVAVPLIEQATTDGTAYLTARGRMWAASDATGLCAGSASAAPRAP